MPVPSQEYDSSCPFVFDAFCFLILPCDYGLSKLIFLWVQYFCDFTFYRPLFGVSRGFVLKTVPWPIMFYFYKLWLGWRVVSLALICVGKTVFDSMYRGWYKWMDNDIYKMIFGLYIQYFISITLYKTFKLLKEDISNNFCKT